MKVYSFNNRFININLIESVTLDEGDQLIKIIMNSGDFFYICNSNIDELKSVFNNLFLQVSQA